MSTLRLLFLLAVGLSFHPAADASAENTVAIKEFFGRYSGQAISSMEEGLSKRDLSVRISDAGKGAFTLDWITFTRKDDGRRKRKSYTITFRPTSRDHVYGSAMRKDKFGNAVALDPLKGEPYVWARIDGKNLIVYAMHIIENGGYEMQEYIRTLTEDGLALRFSRVRNGEQLKLITGTLKRYGD